VKASSYYVNRYFPSGLPIEDYVVRDCRETGKASGGAERGFLIRLNRDHATQRRVCDLSRPMIASTNSGKQLLEAPPLG